MHTYGLTCKKPGFKNLMGDWKDAELEAAEKHGVRPMHPSDPGFAKMVADNPDVKFKWCVDNDGNIGLVPSRVKGMDPSTDADIKHSVVFPKLRGDDDRVKYAGEARLEVGPDGGIVATQVTPRSGHYNPDVDTVHPGADELRKAGIEVPPEAVTENIWAP